MVSILCMSGGCYRRALELSFALIDENNIRSVVKELVNFLDVAEGDFKAYTASNLVAITERWVKTIEL